MKNCADCPKARTEAQSPWIAPRRDVPLSGILNVDKPAGMTSHDVVDAVRRMSGQRKVGHTGTLDPMATGVLPVCLGQATRVAEYVMAGLKCYRAGIGLGTSTDTYDADGEITSEGGRTDFTRAELGAALAEFLGRIEQVPPMYSAIKQGGVPLYKLARRGEVVERKPRPVEIDSIVIADWTPPSLIVEVVCSPGTYIRSLAHDLGQRLGCGAYLATLVRLRSGQFSLGQAVSLDRLEEAFRHGQEDRYMLPFDEALLHWPAVVVTAARASRILHGSPVQGEPPTSGGDGPHLGRVYGPDGDFLAIAEYQAGKAQWQPKKVFGTETR
jgi:tRNA pseudouridine55 synthase